MTSPGGEVELAGRLVRHVRAASIEGRLLVDHPLHAPLHALLLEHRASPLTHVDDAAEALAGAAFGSHHLWEDLGADGREEVSGLMRTCFPKLFAANTEDLRWKRFLFLALGQRTGKLDLRPPKCDGCGDYDRCFDPAHPAIPIRKYEN